MGGLLPKKFDFCLITKKCLELELSCKNNIFTHKFSYSNPVADLWPFKVLFSRGPDSLNFCAKLLCIKQKNLYFFRMYKSYYHHILILLLFSNLKKSLRSVQSRVQSSLTTHYLITVTTKFQLLSNSSSHLIPINILYQLLYEFRNYLFHLL